MRPHPVQPVRSQLVNFRFDRRMLAAGPRESGFRLACPLAPGKAALLRHRHDVEQFAETLAVVRAVEAPDEETAPAQLRIRPQTGFDQRYRRVGVAAGPQNPVVVTRQTEWVRVTLVPMTRAKVGLLRKAATELPSLVAPARVTANMPNMARVPDATFIDSGKREPLNSFCKAT